MSYRTILVQIDTTRGARLRAETAVALAERNKARLTGLFLTSDLFGNGVATEALAFMSTTDLAMFDEQRAASLASEAAAARRILADAAAAADLPFDWLEVNADFDDTVIATARNFDLAILPARMTASHGVNHISAAQVAMGSGGPVLVLPERGYQSNIGEKIVVAWKDSRESARAVRDAMPLLCAAKQVTVVTVSDTAPNPMLALQLESHGCNVHVVVDPRTDAPASDLLRLQVGKAGADMLVMGLYGRPRLRELVLGGVSRDLLDNLPAPLLVSH